MGCPICMDNTRAFHLQHGRKASYFNCHQFLRAGHPYRRNKKAFTKGRVEKSEAPPRANGEKIWRFVRNFKSVVEDPINYPLGYGTEYKWTKRSIFLGSPILDHEHDMTQLDVMHIEKNVFDNIFNTVMNINGEIKDTLNARKDVGIICNRPEIAMDLDRPGFMAKAIFLHTLKNKVKNKAVVESSICEAYIVEEISTFATHYFEPDVICKRRRPGRNDDGLKNESVKH
ncbi:UNVERIFIED_CONTAM: hypothetical protein Sradi_3985500 [Sesamum radiatum]|uniref:DUF4218 domain-containing protein n=1 Tax=Sesamum radiatum TaxID=300843 RepID=A0AAW2PLW2_SESRA